MSAQWMSDNCFLSDEEYQAEQEEARVLEEEYEYKEQERIEQEEQEEQEEREEREEQEKEQNEPRMDGHIEEEERLIKDRKIPF